ncbi:FAD-dependent oxidoreductase [Saccharomonospora piscinae]|uniref:FAD-dependent oxidoreductase n=1 Tax=Saccharomonospora piscinae TaxID=687388 RepID=UPI0004652F8E|nr:FAD-dependent oxidoreductase [Saccharomonospora piscinae]
MTPRRVVVLGYGMAGARLADEVVRRDPDGERVALTVVGDEPHPAYNRVLLSSVLAGSLSADAVRLHEPGWAAAHGVDLRVGTRACRLDRRARRVWLADGAALDYDTLVLATGSTPWLPPVEGLACPGGLADGVVAFRTLDDCERLVAAARPGAPVVVVGGGLLGLEAARGLAGRGSLVTVVHPASHVLNRQLDAAAGGVLAATLRDAGVEFRLGRGVAGYVPGDGVKLDDGTHLDAELVVVAAGVRAETALARDAGLAVEQGVVVDDALRTSDGRIHALGDCAQHPGTASGLVQPAWEQAAVLADLLTGTDVAARYRGTAVVTRLKARGVELTALGESCSEPDEVGDPDAEVVRVHDPARRRYAKLVLRRDRVTGAALLGFPDAAAVLTQLHDRAVPAPADRLALLLGRALPTGARTTGGNASPADLPGSAIVCRCNSVTKAALVTAWRSGATTVDGLSARTRAGTGCGGCTDTVCGIADWLASSS